MKPLFHQVPSGQSRALTARHDVIRSLSSIWHYHPQLELHCVMRGEGVRFIGDNIDNFSTGEIILIGENLPHNWQCSDAYFQQNPETHFEAVVIHFLPTWLGKDFLSLSEAVPLAKLYEKARHGLLVRGELAEQIRPLMLELVAAAPLRRIMLLLDILHRLIQADSIESLAPGYTFYPANEQETIRLNRVYNHTLAYFTREIPLEEIAAVASLSVTSFCRYFKTMTQKTYRQFVNEIRISYACRALLEDLQSIQVICFECGFNNVSNFYRQFKKVQGVSPLEYQKSQRAKLASPHVR